MIINYLIVFLTYFLFVVHYIDCFSYTSGTCGLTTKNQSPVNIFSNSSIYYEEKYFRILTNNYGILPKKTVWKQFPELKAVGFQVSSNSSILIVKDWSIYRFILQRVIFRSVSEHKIDGNSFDVEMQLYHSLDSTYVGLGRQQAIPVSNLVISLFFQRPSGADDIPDDFFKYSNLINYNGQGQTFFLRDIKLGNIIQNVPSYLYQGTYTNPSSTLPAFSGCDDTFWIIMSKYGIISNDEYNSLNKILEISQFKDIVIGSNGRDINPFFSSNNVYRNFNNVARLLVEKSYFRYNSSQNIRLYFFFVLFIFILFL